MAVGLFLPQPQAHPSTPLPYTGSPLLLCLSDIRLFLALIPTLRGIFTPLTQYRAGALDELYPSLPNLWCLFLHAFLLLFQTVFLLSLPLLLVLPVWVVVVYLAGVYGVTRAVAWVLNGGEEVLESGVGGGSKGHEGERWIYLNGVAVGRHWLRGNVELLTATFGRSVTGLHNRTYGLLFDLLQCILERDFLYASAAIRRAHAAVKAALLDPHTKKVVLILHSQGGIQGGMVLDWLLGELPHATLAKLEIYTFGSAANHFNNPVSHSPSLPDIHIEHFAHTADFVARWGVLHFSTPSFPNRYAGRVFVCEGSGHLLGMHYLGDLFPVGEVGEGGEGWSGVSMLEGEKVVEGVGCRKGSRLWGYRDGGML